MKRSVKYLLGGILALLGFSSCTALREARDARAERERQAFEAQQRALVEQTLQEMLEADANDPKREPARLDTIRRADRERNVLLYAVPNVPYREIKEK